MDGVVSRKAVEGGRQYEEEGYVLLERIFQPNAVASLFESFAEVLSGQAGVVADINTLILTKEAQDHSLVYKASQSVGSSSAAYQLLGSSSIFENISALTGFPQASLHLMPMYLIVQLPSDERFDYVWHQDGSYYPWCTNFLTLWFPINRGTNSENGTISIIPGSHRAGLRETKEHLKNGFFKQLESRLEPGEERKEKILKTELGDCCVMHGNTIHRSVANRSESPRVAGLLRLACLTPSQIYDRERFYCAH